MTYEPAIKGRVGECQEWIVDGELHREDGPAHICEDGTTEWYINGELHRTDGPALMWPDGGKEWYLYGKLHREDGPAITCLNGHREWHLNGLEMSEGEHAILARKQGFLVSTLEVRW